MNELLTLFPRRGSGARLRATIASIKRGLLRLNPRLSQIVTVLDKTHDTWLENVG